MEYMIYKKNILSKGNQDDYMSLSTGYDYQEETYDKITKIKDLIKQIFPIESERNAYMTILASGLIGEGRMAEPENIVSFVIDYFRKTNSLNGKKAMV